MEDADIDYSDIPELTDEQLAQLRPTEELLPTFAKPGQTRVTLYLDNDMLQTLRRQADQAGCNYHALIKKALHDYLSRELKSVTIDEETRRRVIR